MAHTSIPLNLISENNLTSACITAKSMAAGDEALIKRINRAHERLGYGYFLFDGSDLRILSSKGDQEYRVTEGGCQCIDFLMHGGVCKHQVARVLLQIAMIVGRTEDEWRVAIEYHKARSSGGFMSRLERQQPHMVPSTAEERVTDADYAAIQAEVDELF